jgi:hypothetical protein
MPAFLAIELIFKQLPLHLTIGFSANQQLKNRSTENIIKLFTAIISPLLAIADALIYLSINRNLDALVKPLLLFSFMDLPDQKRIIYDHPYTFEFASSEIKSDREFALTLVGQNGLSLIYLTDQFKNDREIVLTALRNNLFAIESASLELQHDPEIRQMTLSF